MIDNYPEVHAAHESDDLLFGTVESWIVYNLVGGVRTGLHISEVTNASRTLLLDTTTLQWSQPLVHFFNFRASVLPRLVSTSEVYGYISKEGSRFSDGKISPLAGVPIGGLVGDQQGALIGNKCLRQGEAKCTYGTGAFLLFCTGEEIVKSNHGLLSTVRLISSHRRNASSDLLLRSHTKPDPTLNPSMRSKAVVRALPRVPCLYPLIKLLAVAVAGSAIKWLRDSMHLISDAGEVNALAAQEATTGGVYFVTAFSGLLAPYWDSGAAGVLIGISQYTNPSHLARATLEANAFQTRAIIESMKLDSGSDLKHLKVDGGMTNGDLCMEVLADIGGFGVVRPVMRESVLHLFFFLLYLLTTMRLQIYRTGLRLTCRRCYQTVRLGLVQARDVGRGEHQRQQGVPAQDA